VGRLRRWTITTGSAFVGWGFLLDFSAVRKLEHGEILIKIVQEHGNNGRFIFVFGKARPSGTKRKLRSTSRFSLFAQTRLK
jgi:hypothetical protein